MDGWMGAKAIFRIAYNNQNAILERKKCDSRNQWMSIKVSGKILTPIYYYNINKNNKPTYFKNKQFRVIYFLIHFFSALSVERKKVSFIANTL